MNEAKVRKAAVKISVVCLSLVLSFAIAEIVARLYFRDDYSVLTGRAFDQRYEKLNSLGHRDREFSPFKPAGTVRLLAVGDSCTFGQGVKDPSGVYTEILENDLNTMATDVHYEVLNVARKGMNAAEYLQSIKTFGPAYDIDIVLIGFFINDIEWDKQARPRPSILLPLALHSRLSHNSYVYWYTYSALDGLYNNQQFLDYRLSYTSKDSNDWQHFVRVWNEILTTCRANNWPVVVALLPYLIQLDDTYPFADVHARVRALSEAQDALVIDLFLAVKGYRAEDMHIGRTDAHPGAKAHKLFANEIFRSLKTSGFLTRFQAEHRRPDAGAPPRPSTQL